MKKNRSLSLTVISLFIMATNLRAQSQDDIIVAPVVQDSAAGSTQTGSAQVEEPDILGDTTLYINHITLGKDTADQWRAEKAFAYMQYLDSMLRAKKAGLNNKPKDRIAHSGNSWMENVLKSQVLHAFLWIAAGVFVFFIVYKLFLDKGVFVRYARQEKASDLQPEKEEIQDADFRQLIRQAVSQADYRKAVRYQYLHALQQLSAKGILQLASDKTNAAYVRDLPMSSRQSFASLTLTYEYVWFGHQAVSESLYHEIEQAFDHFNNGKA